MVEDWWVGEALAVLELSQGHLGSQCSQVSPCSPWEGGSWVWGQEAVRRPVKEARERVTRPREVRMEAGAAARFWVSLEGRTDGVS